MTIIIILKRVQLLCQVFYFRRIERSRPAAFQDFFDQLFIDIVFNSDRTD